LLTIVRRTASLWWSTWPWLVAIYLVGWVIRYWVRQAAIAVALAHGVLWGKFVVVFAPIVRLLTYLAMFLAIRSATRELRDVRVGAARQSLFDTFAASRSCSLIASPRFQLTTA
jgi:hypothetical protein